MRAWAGAEYPLLRFLERNGYDVSYQAGLDTHHRGLPQGTRLFISVGHDEYWSGPQRAAVEAARDAGTHLAFFSGNEVYCAFPLVVIVARRWWCLLKAKSMSIRSKLTFI